MTNSIGIMGACRMSDHDLEEVCCSAVEFAMCCAGRTLQARGKDVMVTMTVDAVNNGQKGLVLDERGKGTDLMSGWLYVCHSVYYSTSHPCLPNNLNKRMVPVTLPERMLLANHDAGSSLAAVGGNELGRSAHPRDWTEGWRRSSVGS